MSIVVGIRKQVSESKRRRRLLSLRVDRATAQFQTGVDATLAATSRAEAVIAALEEHNSVAQRVASRGR